MLTEKNFKKLSVDEGSIVIILLAELFRKNDISFDKYERITPHLGEYAFFNINGTGKNVHFRFDSSFYITHDRYIEPESVIEHAEIRFYNFIKNNKEALKCKT